MKRGDSDPANVDEEQTRVLSASIEQLILKNVRACQ